MFAKGIAEGIDLRSLNFQTGRRGVPAKTKQMLLAGGQGGVQASDRARRVDRIIGPQIKYDSLRVLDFKRRQVELNQIGSVTLPSGNRFRFRPMDLSDQGVLVAVDVERSTQGDFRIPRRKPVFFGGQRYQGGQLVIVLEPDY